MRRPHSREHYSIAALVLDQSDEAACERAIVEHENEHARTRLLPPSDPTHGQSRSSSRPRP
jgi:hypothetical protein